MVGQEIDMGKKGCPLKEAVRDKNGVVGVMSGVYDVVLGGWALRWACVWVEGWALHCNVMQSNCV
jgi:hypothetical protein